MQIDLSIATMLSSVAELDRLAYSMSRNPNLLVTSTTVNRALPDYVCVAYCPLDGGIVHFLLIKDNSQQPNQLRGRG